MGLDSVLQELEGLVRSISFFVQSLLGRISFIRSVEGRKVNMRVLFFQVFDVTAQLIFFKLGSASTHATRVSSIILVIFNQSLGPLPELLQLVMIVQVVIEVLLVLTQVLLGLSEGFVLFNHLGIVLGPVHEVLHVKHAVVNRVFLLVKLQLLSSHKHWSLVPHQE